MSYPAALVMHIANAAMPQQFSILSRLGVKSLDTEAGMLDAPACFFLWTYGLFMRLPCFDANAAETVIAMLIAGRDKIFPPDTPTDNPAFRLALADKRYITSDLTPGQYLDIKAGEMLESLPQPPFESVIYDLGELFRRNARHCEGTGKRDAAYPRNKEVG